VLLVLLKIVDTTPSRAGRSGCKTQVVHSTASLGMAATLVA